MKFDETVEIHMNLGIDVTQSDQMVRGAIPLPFGIGKWSGWWGVSARATTSPRPRPRVPILRVRPTWSRKSRKRASSISMSRWPRRHDGQVSRLGKVLGPRGLMPTPKAGTVVPANADLAAAVREFKAGKVEYRSDKTGQIHAGIGKMSFDDDKLVANITTFVEQVAFQAIGREENFVNGVVLSATMSPSIRISV